MDRTPIEQPCVFKDIKLLSPNLWSLTFRYFEPYNKIQQDEDIRITLNSEDLSYMCSLILIALSENKHPRILTPDQLVAFVLYQPNADTTIRDTLRPLQSLRFLKGE